MSLSLRWTDADGVVHDLYDPTSWIVTEGALGLEAPPVSNTIAPYVGVDGGALVKRRRPVRSFVLPIYVRHTNRAMTQIATVARALQGPGTLTHDDGSTARSLLDVIYESGLEGVRARSAGSAGLGRRFVVSMVALNPWWHDEVREESIGFDALGLDEVGLGFDSATDFEGADTTEINVLGDTSALPTWTIDGPFTKLTVGTGALSFELADALADGDQITIDTTPGNRGPRLNGGQIDWSLLTPESRLWEIPVGDTVITAAASGDDGGSGVTVSFRQRWLTP